MFAGFFFYYWIYISKLDCRRPHTHTHIHTEHLHRYQGFKQTVYEQCVWLCSRDESHRVVYIYIRLDIGHNRATGDDREKPSIPSIHKYDTTIWKWNKIDVNFVICEVSSCYTYTLQWIFKCAELWRKQVAIYAYMNIYHLGIRMPDIEAAIYSHGFVFSSLYRREWVL